jgi:hypothetical protein
MENPWGLVGDAASDRARGHLHEREARWSRGRAGRRRRWHHHAGLWARRRWRARPIAAWLAGAGGPGLVAARADRGLDDTPGPGPVLGSPLLGPSVQLGRVPSGPRPEVRCFRGRPREVGFVWFRPFLGRRQPTRDVHALRGTGSAGSPRGRAVGGAGSGGRCGLGARPERLLGRGVENLLRGLQPQMDRLAALLAKVTGDLTARAAAAAPKGREASAAQRSRQFLHEELNLSPSEAKNTTETGRKLRGAPDTANRFGSGQFGQAHAKVITDPPPRSTRYTVRSWKRCYWTRPARSTRSSSDGSRAAKWPAATRPRQRKRRNVATNAGPARWFRVRTEACTFEPACTGRCGDTHRPGDPDRGPPRSSRHRGAGTTP